MANLARVFVDASVLFAAALSARGYARDLLLVGMRSKVFLSCSAFVLEETERNLTTKAPGALPAFQIFRQALAAQIVRPSRADVLRAARSIELKDAPIVDGAVRARARYLATYDRRHLLAHAGHIEATFGIVVATPDDILTAIGLKEPQ
jgi:predicted nucleic acid-binding protein